MTKNRKIKQKARASQIASGGSYSGNLRKLVIKSESSWGVNDLLTLTQGSAKDLLESSPGNHLLGGNTACGKSTFAAGVALNYLKAGKSVLWVNPTHYEDVIANNLNEWGLSESQLAHYEYVTGNDEIDLEKALKSDLVIVDELCYGGASNLDALLTAPVQTLCVIHAGSASVASARFHGFWDDQNFALNSVTIVDRPRTSEGMEPLVKEMIRR